MTMNTELMLRVADAIEESGRFNLSFWAAQPGGGFEVTPDELLHRCDTVGCVAGWTAAVGASVRVRKNLIVSEVGWTEVAKGLLGLTDKQAERLFMAGADSIWVDFAPVFGWEVDVGGWTINGGLKHWNEIAAEQAAMVLRDIAEGAVVL